MPNPPTQHRPSSEPDWRPAPRFTNAELPPSNRPWLLDDSSLTGRLIGLRRGPFRVQRLLQDWQTPLPSERRLLGLPYRQLALVREVALYLGELPVVFARSVFPYTSLTGELAHLRRLQNRSLGEILFKHPGMHRSPFELALLPGDSAYLPSRLHQATPAWGRRSRFEINGRGLMVSEVFLRDFTPWRCILPVHRSQRSRVHAAFAHAKQ